MSKKKIIVLVVGGVGLVLLYKLLSTRTVATTRPTGATAQGGPNLGTTISAIGDAASKVIGALQNPSSNVPAQIPVSVPDLSGLQTPSVPEPWL